QEFGQEAERLAELGLLGRIHALDFRKDTGQLRGPAARRDVRAHVRVEGQQSDSVPLVIPEIREAGRENPRVIYLFDLARAVVHGPADVEQNDDARVGFTFVQLDEQPVVAAVDVPVNPPDFVAGLVFAVFGEI